MTGGLGPLGDAVRIGMLQTAKSLVRRGCLRFRTLAEPDLLGFRVEFMLWLSVLPNRLDEAGQQLATHASTKYLSATTGRLEATINRIV